MVAYPQPHQAQHIHLQMNGPSILLASTAQLHKHLTTLQNATTVEHIKRPCSRCCLITHMVDERTAPLVHVVKDYKHRRIRGIRPYRACI